MMAMEVRHEVRDVAQCWGKPPDSRPTQPCIQEFAQVMVHLDSMAMWVPLQQAFDEFVYPSYKLCNCHSCHFVVGRVMDLEESMNPIEVAVYDNGHLLSRGRDLLFKGQVLVYDLENASASGVHLRLIRCRDSLCRRVVGVCTQRGCEGCNQARLPHREVNGDLRKCSMHGSH